MKNPQKKKRSIGGKIFTGVAIAITAFLILSGACLLMVGEETVGAIVCIAIGAVGLLFTIAGSFLASHPGNRFAIGLMASVGILVGGGAVLVMFLGAGYALLVKPYIDIEHYRQVWQTPATVSAVVTKHDSYDNDGDTHYKSYITYIYGKTRYKGYPYEDRAREDQLTPVGTIVAVQISPKDPTKQISELKRSSKTVPIVVVFLLAGLVALYTLAQRSNLKRKDRGTPDTDTIRKNIKAKIRCRYLRPFLLLGWVCYGFLYWRYAFVLGRIPLIIAAVCGAGWLYCMYAAIRDARYAENGDFELHRDVLVDMQEYTDDESSTYTLYYQCGERSWRKNVNSITYARAQIGDTVIAVYLPGRKKPIIHYDADGNVH